MNIPERTDKTIRKLVREIVDGMSVDDLVNYVQDSLFDTYKLNVDMFEGDWEFYMEQ